VSPGVFLTLTATVAVAALTPGPAVVAIVGRAIASGARSAMAINAGVVTGDVLFLGFAAAGMSAAARTMGDAFEILRWLGALYLAWQGLALWRRRPVASQASVGSGAGFWRNYSAGLLLMFGHVQAMLFYAALLPGFVDLGALGWRDLGLTAAMIVVVIGGINTGYALLASRARRFIADVRAQMVVQRVAGTLMFVAAALVAGR
jgi:threonine/homoserine/homoserine lactone efflux protein